MTNQIDEHHLTGTWHEVEPYEGFTRVVVLNTTGTPLRLPLIDAGSSKSVEAHIVFVLSESLSEIKMDEVQVKPLHSDLVVVRLNNDATIARIAVLDLVGAFNHGWPFQCLDPEDFKIIANKNKSIHLPVFRCGVGLGAGVGAGTKAVKAALENIDDGFEKPYNQAGGCLMVISANPQKASLTRHKYISTTANAFTASMGKHTYWVYGTAADVSLEDDEVRVTLMRTQ